MTPSKWSPKEFINRAKYIQACEKALTFYSYSTWQVLEMVMVLEFWYAEACCCGSH
ncbi:hypothetical protein ACS0TY_015346 [Phlomoides rotata]